MINVIAILFLFTLYIFPSDAALCKDRLKQDRLSPSQTFRLKQFFREYDKNTDGRLSYYEFLQSCKAAQVSGTINKCKLFFDLYDKDHDGFITQHEMSGF